MQLQNWPTYPNTNWLVSTNYLLLDSELIIECAVGIYASQHAKVRKNSWNCLCQCAASMHGKYFNWTAYILAWSQFWSLKELNLYILNIKILLFSEINTKTDQSYINATIFDMNNFVVNQNLYTYILLNSAPSSYKTEVMLVSSSHSTIWRIFSCFRICFSLSTTPT